MTAKNNLTDGKRQQKKIGMMNTNPDQSSKAERIIIYVICAILLLPADLFATPMRENTGQLPQPCTVAKPQKPRKTPPPSKSDTTVYLDAELLVKTPSDSIAAASIKQEASDTILTVVTDPNSPYGLDGKIPFNPSPTRALWLSALFPGIGQIYNRRYWKLPIIIGGFMGLGYATSWNNGQFKDYTQAYRDLLDSDPNTKSYMNFFPPTTNESDLDPKWLENTLKSRKDYYRRNRDLCIICIAALYLLCMLDAYVDASLAHFDISDNLALDMSPTILISPTNNKITWGLNWALRF